MKVVIQKCSKASVSVDNAIYNEIKKGLVLLVSFTNGDTEEDILYAIKKITNLRIFDEVSIRDIEGEILSISQFTLYADLKKGNRPSYSNALHSSEAKVLYDLFNEKLSEEVSVKTGVFGANMQVELVNDGPYTLLLDTKNR